MKSVRRAGLLGALFVIMLFAAACATGPGPNLGPVSCTLLSKWDLDSFGATSATNPFMAPVGLIYGTPDELIALDLALSLPDAGTVNVDAAVKNENGDVVARLYSLPDLRQYWSNWGDASDRDTRTRLGTLERWTLPSSQFVGQKGHSEFVIVLIGKNPLPRPATIAVSISLNAVEQVELNTPLPPKKK